MDPATIASAAITILSPYVKQAGEALVKTVGEVAVEKVRGLLGWLKERFQGDSSATQDLSHFESDPDKFAPALEKTLKAKIRANPGFAAELKKRVDEVGPLVVVSQKVKDGTDVVAVDAELHSGRVVVSQDAERVKNLTGFKGKIGS